MAISQNPVVDTITTDAQMLFYIDQGVAIFKCIGNPQGVITANAGSVAPNESGVVFVKTTNDSSLGWSVLGFGTVNPGAANKLAYYPSAGATVDDATGLEWDDTTEQFRVTGSLGIGLAPVFPLDINREVSAVDGLGYGVRVVNTLAATAEGDELAGLRVVVVVDNNSLALGDVSLLDFVGSFEPTAGTFEDTFFGVQAAFEVGGAGGTFDDSQVIGTEARMANFNASDLSSGIGNRAFFTHAGAGVLAQLLGSSVLAEVTGDGTATTLAGFATNLRVSGAGSADRMIGLLARSGVDDGTGAITELYGVLIEDQTAGVTDWAIKTGLGLVEFGDLVKFSGTNSTGAGAALLGANSPAATLAAPYTWIKAKVADGSDVWIPCWK